MDFLVDSLTRAPSQVLVKSASQFGEEAAKVLGACVEESLKACTDDITTSIKENIQITGKKISKELDKFSQVFKETAVEGFTEWGIGIERAFFHLGHKLENGLNNTANRLAVQLDQSIAENVDRIDTSLRDNVDMFSKNFLRDQIPYWRESFMREVNIVMICICMVSLGLFIMCLSWALGGYQVFGYILMNELKTITFILFALLNGFSLYIWNRCLNNSQVNAPEKVDLNISSVSSDSSDSKILNATSSMWVQKIFTEQHKHYQKNPQLLIVIVGCFGFFMGHLARDIFSSFSAMAPSSGAVMQILGYLFSWIHLFLVMSLMIVVTLTVNKVLAWDLSMKVYTLWKDWLKFREFLKSENQDSVKIDPITVEAVSPTKSSDIVDISVGSEDQLEKFVDDEEESDSEPVKSQEVQDHTVSSTAFILYCREFRPALTERYPDWTYFEIRKELEQNWKLLGKQEQERYEKNAAELMKETSPTSFTGRNVETK